MFMMYKTNDRALLGPFWKVPKGHPVIKSLRRYLLNTTTNKGLVLVAP